MSRKTIFPILISLILLLLIASACNRNTDDEKTPEMVYTEAAETVAAEMTRLAGEGDQPTATWTPEPESDSESTPTPEAESPTATETTEEDLDPTPTENQQEPTRSGPCSLAADYVADVTYPDDTVVSPGETFTKTWQIMNSGSCTWGDGYTIFYISGDNLSAPDGVSLTNGIDVPEGTMINVSITLTAPAEEGTYRADFKFKDAAGTIFGTGAGGGGTVYVQIIVAEPTPEPSNTPAATATPTPTEAPTEEPTPEPSPTP